MEILKNLFEWIQAFPSSTAIRESIYGYPALLTGHVISMCFFAGLIIMMDLRLAGLGNTRTSVSQIQNRLFPLQMLAFGMSAITGLMLFYGQPMRFYGNFFFWLKTVLMVLAALNAFVFHQITYKSVKLWDNSPITPLGAKIAGDVSLILWACVVVSGRLIAYNWFDSSF